MKVFCVYGWADVSRESKYQQVTQWDYSKIKRFLAGRWPKPIGERIDFGGEHADTCDVPDLPWTPYDPRAGGLDGQVFGAEGAGEG